MESKMCCVSRQQVLRFLISLLFFVVTDSNALPMHQMLPLGDTIGSSQVFRSNGLFEDPNANNFIVPVDPTARRDYSQAKLTSYSLPSPTPATAVQGNQAAIDNVGIPLPLLANGKLTEENKAAMNELNQLLTSIGVSLPELLPSPDNIGIRLPGVSGNQNNQGNLNIDFELNSNSGIPLPRINSASLSTSFPISSNDQSQPFGIHLPKISSNSQSSPPQQPQIGYSSSALSENNAGSSIGVGLPLNNVNANQQSFSSGIPLPTISSTDNTFSTGTLDGIPFPELQLSNSEFNNNNGFSNLQPNSHSGIPLSNLPINSVSSDSISQPSLSSVGIALPGSESSLPSGGVPLPSIDPSINKDSANFGISLPGVGNENQISSLVDPAGIQIPATQNSNGNVGIPLPGIGENDSSISALNNSDLKGISDMLGDITVGEYLMGLNGQNGIVVVPMSSVLGENSDGNNSVLSQLTTFVSNNNDAESIGIPLPGISSSNSASDGGSTFDSFGSFSEVGKPLPGLSDSSSGSSSSAGVPLPGLDLDGLDLEAAFATSTTTTPRPRTTTKNPNVLRRTLSDLLFTKGQWFGTLIGGIVDMGIIVFNSFNEHFINRNNDGTASATYS